MPATPKQIKYIEGLAIDCGFDRVQRNAFISRELDREVKALDDLAKPEASTIIQAFLELKNNMEQNIPIFNSPDHEDDFDFDPSDPYYTDDDVPF